MTSGDRYLLLQAAEQVRLAAETFAGPFGPAERAWACDALRAAESKIEADLAMDSQRHADSLARARAEATR